MNEIQSDNVHQRMLNTFSISRTHNDYLVYLELLLDKRQWALVRLNFFMLDAARETSRLKGHHQHHENIRLDLRIITPQESFKINIFIAYSNLIMHFFNVPYSNFPMRKDPELTSSLFQKMSKYTLNGYARKITDKESLVKHDCVWHLPIFVVKNPNINQQNFNEWFGTQSLDLKVCH